MSSSRRSDMSVKKRFTADTEGLPCPECGRTTLSWTSGECKLHDGVVVPNLDRIQCSSCGEYLLDLKAMQQIREFRGSQKTRARNRHVSVKKISEPNNA